WTLSAISRRALKRWGSGGLPKTGSRYACSALVNSRAQRAQRYRCGLLLDPHERRRKAFGEVVAMEEKTARLPCNPGAMRMEDERRRGTRCGDAEGSAPAPGERLVNVAADQT